MAVEAGGKDAPESALGFTCRPYHPLSRLRTKPGYYPNLEPQHLLALREFHQSLLSERSDRSGPTVLQLQLEHVEGEEILKMLRFLRARNFDVQKSLEMYRKDAAWRESTFITEPPKDGPLTDLCPIHALPLQSAQEVLQIDDEAKLQQFFKFFPTWMQGYDKELRPISWRKFGRLEISSVMKLTTMENLARFHAWESEQALRMMKEQSQNSGYNIETFCIVIDAKGWTPKLATSEAFTFIKHMTSIDADHHPERLGRLFLINAPTLLTGAWKIVQKFLDDVTKKKIQIFGGPKTWLPALLEVVEADQIPLQYGGTAPDFTQEEAFASMNPPPSGSGGGGRRSGQEAGPPLSASSTSPRGGKENAEESLSISGTNQVPSKEMAASSSSSVHDHHPEQVRLRFKPAPAP